jgi:hypothetical protein
MNSGGSDAFGWNATPTSDDESRLILSVLTKPEIIERAERAEEEDIRTFLEMATDYRKGAVRKLAIEPFLVLLRNVGVISEDVVATRELPLNRMVKALLDYLGVDPRRRPTSLRTIVHDIKRDFPKRPAQRPKG